ncbi:MAG: DNA recombination protein RmuC [Microbacteriaceae bacterium]|nr:DNA recombination protein RmuC [Microbacteriaceae bacterium]
MELWIAVAYALGGLVVGIFLSFLLLSRKTARLELEAASKVSEAEKQAAVASATSEALKQELETLRELRETDAERERLQVAEENKVLQQLAPVKQIVEQMQVKVQDLEKERASQYSMIEEQLRNQKISGEQLRMTTESLASALKSNSTRGVWGETQLRRVVEAAGMLDHVDFTTQETFANEDGKVRPDMVINLPGGKKVPVDSKVPLDAFLEASQIPDTASAEELARRKTLLTKHKNDLRGHIDALQKRNYETIINTTPDFVILFLPNENLLSSALEIDPGLMDYAFSKRIALASPVNLWAVIKTIAFTWQQELVTEDAKEFFKLMKELYERIGTIADYSEDLRKAIVQTVTKYNAFQSSLESRVLSTARKLQKLSPDKVLGVGVEIDELPKQSTAPELAQSADE